MVILPLVAVVGMLTIVFHPARAAGTGVTVRATVFAASIRIDTVTKWNVRAVIFDNHGARLIRQEFRPDSVRFVQRIRVGIQLLAIVFAPS
jgi:hypothetical protein